MPLRVLAVFTALLFLLALVQGCSAAGGDEGSESAYISFLITKSWSGLDYLSLGNTVITKYIFNLSYSNLQSIFVMSESTL